MTSIQKIKRLSYDPIFGVMTRPALDIYIEEHFNKKIFHCVFIDICNLHNLNNELGYETVNEIIKDICSKIKHCKITINKKSQKINAIGRWFSGDELLIICENPETFVLSRFMDIFREHNINFRYDLFYYVRNIDELKTKIRLLK